MINKRNQEGYFGEVLDVVSDKYYVKESDNYKEVSKEEYKESDSRVGLINKVRLVEELKGNPVEVSYIKKEGESYFNDEEELTTYSGLVDVTEEDISLLVSDIVDRGSDYDKLLKEESNLGKIETVSIQGQLEDAGILIKLREGSGIGVEVKDISTWDMYRLMQRVEETLIRVYDKGYVKGRVEEGVRVKV